MKTAIKYIGIIVLIILLSNKQTFCQNVISFDSLISETNKILKFYGNLNTFESSSFSLKSLPINIRKRGALKRADNYRLNDSLLTDDPHLSKNKDSIGGFYAIELCIELIQNNIKKIVKHNDFLKHDVSTLLDSNVLNIIKSPDNRLFNFSFVEKNGGSYVQNISMTYFVKTNISKATGNNNLLEAIYLSQYDKIDTIQTIEGTKYLLQGYIRGCNSCLQNYIKLVQYKEGRFITEFEYAIKSRSWNDGIEYNYETKTININYHTDDLTTHCYCETDSDHIYDNEIQSKKCKCVFQFDGLTFQSIEESK